MTTIHFIRHGQVENPDNVFYGRLPGFPLNEEGRQCLKYTAKQLERYSIAAIYASPLLRTQQSAEIIGQHFNLKVETDERLIEIASLFEGKPMGEYDHIVHHPNEAGQREGYLETMDDIYERMAAFVRERVAQHPNQEIVAVTHRSPIRILEMGIQNMPFTDWAYELEDLAICGSDTVVTVEGSEIKVGKEEL